MAADRPTGHITRKDAEHIVEVLNRHQVNYVVIGGMALFILQPDQSVRPTADFDVLVRDSPENLQRLGAALKELRTQRETDVDAFISEVERFETEAGAIDVLRTALGVGTYEELDRAKMDCVLLRNWEEVPALGLPALIAAKEENFDDNDRTRKHLEALHQLADENGVPHRSLAEVERDRQHEDPWDR